MAARGAQRIRTADLRSTDELREVASTCTLCRLCRDRTQVVTGSGDPTSEVLVVVEAPGYHEDRSGVLLAGAAGEVFDELLASIGLDRASVWLTSMVKCRPPANRAAFPDEVEACEGWLFREIGLVQPRLVLTFGAQAMRLVTGRQSTLQDARGQLLSTVVQGRTVGVLPCYHPAAAMHVPALLDALRDDVRAVPVHLRTLAAADGPSIPVLASLESPLDVEVPGTGTGAVPGTAPGSAHEPDVGGDDQLAFPLA